MRKGPKCLPPLDQGKYSKKRQEHGIGYLWSRGTPSPSSAPGPLLGLPSLLRAMLDPAVKQAGHLALATRALRAQPEVCRGLQEALRCSRQRAPGTGRRAAGSGQQAAGTEEPAPGTGRRVCRAAGQVQSAPEGRRRAEPPPLSAWPEPRGGALSSEGPGSGVRGPRVYTRPRPGAPPRRASAPPPDAHARKPRPARPPPGMLRGGARACAVT